MPINVVGTDGKVPVQSPPGWRMLSMDEVYFHNGPAEGKIVPKVGDYVKDTLNNIDYSVVLIHPTTQHPTLVPKPASSEGAISQDEILSDLKGNLRAITSFVYIDKSVLPYRMDVDAGVYIYHPEASYAKIFLGASLQSGPEVISQMYNPSGQVVSNQIPLTAVALNNISNVAIRGIGSCYTTADVPDRSIVTVGVYRADNVLIYSKQLFVENTAFIRNLGSTDRVISHVALQSPYLDGTVADQINIPLGTNISLNNFTAVIHYLNGDTLSLPIDGSRCRLSNLENLSLLTVEGHTAHVGLVYTLLPGEQAQGVTSHDNNTILTSYTAVMVARQAAYTAKLYAFPIWTGTTYTLKWYLYSLSRNYRFVVPSNLLSFSGAHFDGSLYGEQQTLNVSVNLNQVNGSLNAHTHSQVVKIVLLDDGLAATSNWRVKHSDVPGDSFYTNVNASAHSINKINLSAGSSDYIDWLNKVYHSNYPVIDNTSEYVAPTPTHVRVIYSTETKEITIGEYSDDLTFVSSLVIGSNIYLEFIKRVSGTDQLLGCSVMTLKNG